MTIQFDQIQSSRRTPGVESEINTKGAQQSPSPNRQKLMLVGQRMGAKISTPSFIPTAAPGLDDCSIGGTAAFTGSELRKFIIQIVTEAATDIFKWSKDGGATWTLNVNADTSEITLTEGVKIVFGALTGHKAGDKWNFYAFPAGTVAQKIPKQVLRVGEAKSYYGQGSILHRAMMACLETAEKYGSIDVNCTALDDGAGVAATGAVQVVGTATAAGYFRLKVGNERFEVAYASGDTADEIALALKGELDKDAGLDLAVMCHRLAGTLSKITFTAKNLGTLGNDISLSYESTSNSGITGTVTDMASGATDPSNLDDGLDAFQGTRYHIVGCTFSDATNLTTLKTQLDVISGTSEKKYAIAIFGANDTTLATITALASGVNHERVQCIYLKGSHSAPYEIMAGYSALRCYTEDPAAQLNGKRLYGLHIPPVESRLTDAEIETCLWNGVTPITVDESEYAAVVRAICTDITRNYFVDISTIMSADYFRVAVYQRLKSVFEGAKNTTDKPAAVRTEVLFIARQLEAGDPYVVLRKIDDYEDQFVAEEDVADPNRINVAIPTPVVPGLHRICSRFDLIWG